MSCLYLVDSNVFKIVETNAFELDDRGILKQRKDNIEQLVQFTSKIWNPTQQNYTIIKKVHSIVLCILKFYIDLLNQKFLLRVDINLRNLFYKKM